jgi:hypothetical protein
MKILQIQDIDEKVAAGYAEDDTQYFYFVVYKSQNPQIMSRFPKANYKDYDHFAGVIGKFDEYSLLLIKPIEISALTYEECKRVYDIIQKKFGS